MIVSQNNHALTIITTALSKVTSKCLSPSQYSIIYSYQNYHIINSVLVCVSGLSTQPLNEINRHPTTQQTYCSVSVSYRARDHLEHTQWMRPGKALKLATKCNSASQINEFQLNENSGTFFILRRNVFTSPDAEITPSSMTV